MGAFGRARAARVTGGARQYHDEGEFEEVVQKVTFGTTQREGNKFFAHEGKILSIARPPDALIKGCKEGGIVSWTAGKKDYFWSDIKGYILALLDEEDNADAFDEAVSEEAFDAICTAVSGKHQIAAGARINARGRCFVDKDKNEKTGYVIVHWSGVPEEEQTPEGKVFLDKARFLMFDYAWPSTAEMDEAEATVTMRKEVDKAMAEYEARNAAPAEQATA